ncbi:MAG: helix-turn-helix domain-containing protein [Balneolaceae bacterium]
MPKKIGNLTLYTVEDLHERLGISKMTLRTYLREGKLKGRKMGVQWFVTEEAIRDYFEESQPDADSKASGREREYRYVVQGVNDLVSETDECNSLKETIESINSQAIISLFQVAVIDRETNETVELIKARDFLERYG